mmetsp:Transcript_18154/g.30521  ORF Transcript_18154/g.30521 Transcript_18154/m.30521 type:complete len:310 (-) Transcript_18154:205-1134(-)
MVGVVQDEMRRRFETRQELLARRKQEDREAQLRQQELEERLARVHRRRQEDALRDRLPRDESNTVPPTTTSQSASEPAEPSCRICHGGSEEGRLFSPCLCRGTVGKVHVECLNAWRAMSTNSQSFYKCDLCGYKYNTKRADFADFLESKALVHGVASALVMLLVCISAIIVSFVASSGGRRFDLRFLFYDLVMWRPAWKYWGRGVGRWQGFYSWLAGACDWTVGGAVLLGLLGFLVHIVRKFRVDRQYVYNYMGPSLLAAVVQHGAPVFRIFAALGVAVSYQSIYTQLHETSKHLLTKFGEHVLEVQPE